VEISPATSSLVPPYHPREVAPYRGISLDYISIYVTAECTNFKKKT
jgi:hypothetical protein